MKSIFIWFGTLCGFAVGAYIFFFCLEYYFTISKFRDYLASELYTVHSELLQKKKRSDAIGADLNEFNGGNFDDHYDDSLQTKRGKVSHSFHNAILGDEGKVLNRSRRGLFCCASKRLSHIYEQAHEFTD